MKKKLNILNSVREIRFLWLVIMFGLIILIVTIYFFQILKNKKTIYKNYYDVDIVFFDGSLNKEDPSGKVIIDGIVVYQVDSISKNSLNQSKINLEKGPHILEVSTADDQYKIIDTIEIKQQPFDYKLYIEFNYDPPTEEYKKIIINHIYQKNIKNKEYTELQKAEIFEQVVEKINTELENDMIYQPTDKHFQFYFNDMSHFLIE